MDKNMSKIPAPSDKEKIKVSRNRVRIPFVIEGVHDDGSSYTKKKVVLMAYDESEARAYARRHLEKRSDDYFKIESVRGVTEEDVFVEVM